MYKRQGKNGSPPVVNKHKGTDQMICSLWFGSLHGWVQVRTGSNTYCSIYLKRRIRGQILGVTPRFCSSAMSFSTNTIPEIYPSPRESSPAGRYSRGICQFLVLTGGYVCHSTTTVLYRQSIRRFYRSMLFE